MKNKHFKNFMFFKSINQKIKELGFEKTYESNFVIEFQRENKQFNYIHEVGIIHKQSGNHLIQSYQKDSQNVEFDVMVGLTFYEIELFLKYAKKLKW